jgi:hypothetical protein
MPENSQRIVKMFWADRLGKRSDAYQATLGHTVDQISNSIPGESHTALWYSFNRTTAENALVDPALGVFQIWFRVQERGTTKTHNQGGVGFAIQDTLLLGHSSCWVFGSTGFEAHLKIAVSAQNSIL